MKCICCGKETVSNDEEICVQCTIEIEEDSKLQRQEDIENYNACRFSL